MLLNWVVALSTLAVAAATIVLVWVTKKYADLTHALVRLQIDPNIEVGFEGEFEGKPTLVLHNSGGESVIGIHVNTQLYIFRNPSHPPIMHEGLSLQRVVPEKEERSWWDVNRLGSDDILKKDAMELVKHYSQNVKGMEQMILSGMFHDAKTKEPIKPEKVSLWAFITFDVKYRREVDRKLYRILKTGVLVPEADSDRFFLHDAENWLAIAGTSEALEHIKQRTNNA